MRTAFCVTRTLLALGALSTILPLSAQAMPSRSLPRHPGARSARQGDSDAHFKSPPKVRPAKNAGKTVKGGPVSQSELADAILSDALDRIWEQADAHFHLGEYNHTINLNRIVIQSDPGNLDAYGNSAWLLWSTDRNEDAITLLKQGLAANPDTYYMYDELGRHYLTNLKDAPSALPYYEKAVQFDCPYSTWHGLAHCYETLKQWSKAVDTWKAATKYKDDALAPLRLERARKQLAAETSGTEAGTKE